MKLNSQYFRFRGRFDFSPNRFEIGNPVIQNKVRADKFLLDKALVEVSTRWVGSKTIILILKVSQLC